MLSLPYPPTMNHLHSVFRGRKILSKVGRDYQTEVAIAVLKAGRPRAEVGRLSVEIDVYPPDKRRRDIANVEKAINDGLVKAGVIEDDCLIDRLLITRMPVAKGGRITVTISILC